jgi:hypothetical protein
MTLFNLNDNDPCQGDFDQVLPELKTKLLGSAFTNVSFIVVVLVANAGLC